MLLLNEKKDHYRAADYFHADRLFSSLSIFWRQVIQIDLDEAVILREDGADGAGGFREVKWSDFR